MQRLSNFFYKKTFFTLILTVWGYIPDMLDSNFHNEKKKF